MAHAVSSPLPPFSSASGRLEVHQVPVWQDNLVWLLVDAESRAAAAIDGPESGPVVAYCEEHALKLGAIFNTHVHGDHIGINRELEKTNRLPPRVVGAAATASNIPGLTEPVEEGSIVAFGASEGRVMLTEGHLNGHISYVFEDLLFCGDTLFAAGCGYLFDGPPEKMHDSLLRLAKLDGATKVCCAHEYTEDNLRFAWSVEPGNPRLAERIRQVWDLRARGESSVPSTIEIERATNPFMRTGSDEIRSAVAAAFPGTELDSDAAVFAATRALKDSKAYRSAELALPI